jgi:hypothetical protein
MLCRARESPTEAEIELLSSTSESVCEMWNGEGIIRTAGNPDRPTVEFIFKPWKDVDHPARIISLKRATEQENLYAADEGRAKPKQRHYASLDNIDDKDEFTNPNLTLNLPYASISPLEIWSYAVLGIAIQLGILVGSGFITYHWKLDNGHSPAYGYPCFTVGTCVLSVALFVCSHIIEGLTTETTYGPVPIEDTSEKSSWFRGFSRRLSSPFRRKSRIHPNENGQSPFEWSVVRIQQGCIVGDQEFDSYAIFNRKEDPYVRQSRRRKDSPPYGTSGRSLLSWLRGQRESTQDYVPLPKQQDSSERYRLPTLIAVSLAVAGYICQFVGLRAVHWSISIISLGGTLFMTAVRSLARRGLAHEAPYLMLEKGREASSFAMELTAIRRFEVICGTYGTLGQPRIFSPCPKTEALSATKPSSLKGPDPNPLGATGTSAAVIRLAMEFYHAMKPLKTVNGRTTPASNPVVMRETDSLPKTDFLSLPVWNRTLPSNSIPVEEAQITEPLKKQNRGSREIVALFRELEPALATQSLHMAPDLTTKWTNALASAISSVLNTLSNPNRAEQIGSAFFAKEKRFDWNLPVGMHVDGGVGNRLFDPSKLWDDNNNPIVEDPSNRKLGRYLSTSDVFGFHNNRHHSISVFSLFAEKSNEAEQQDGGKTQPIGQRSARKLVWRANKEDLKAILSLWLFTIGSDFEKGMKSYYRGYPSKDLQERHHIWIVGCGGTRKFKELQRWMSSTTVLIRVMPPGLPGLADDIEFPEVLELERLSVAPVFGIRASSLVK